MRKPDGAVVWLHGDHLGSTSLATDAAGEALSRQLYYPFGEVRWSSETPLPTDFGYTGQRLDGTGLMFYHARYYAPSLGRFIQADTIAPSPDDPQLFNRYSYVRNNCLIYVDPTGHFSCAVINGPSGGMDCSKWVYNALAVLDMYGDDEAQKLIDLFWDLDNRFLNDVDVLFWMPIEGVVGIAWPPAQPVDLLLKPDYLTKDPLDPANWQMVATFAHELVHLGQDAWEKVSIQGEAKAYQMEGLIIGNLNNNMPKGYKLLSKSEYTQEVEGLDLTKIEGVLEANERFRDIKGNIYNWQPVFPADQLYFEKWWHQLAITGEDIINAISGLW